MRWTLRGVQAEHSHSGVPVDGHCGGVQADTRVVTTLVTLVMNVVTTVVMNVVTTVVTASGGVAWSS